MLKVEACAVAPDGGTGEANGRSDVVAVLVDLAKGLIAVVIEVGDLAIKHVMEVLRIDGIGLHDVAKGWPNPRNPRKI